MITISWSDIPGTLVVDLTKVGFVTNTRSKRFSSLVGRLCICVKLNASVMSTNPCCIFLSVFFLDCGIEFRLQLRLGLSDNIISFVEFMYNAGG